MDMLLDKIRSALVCVLIGVMTATTASGLSVALIAQRNATTQRVVLGYALAHPLTSWPLELTLWISLSATVGVVAALLLWLAISNIRWTRRPRNLKSAEAAADLMAKSATKGARLFGGKFDGNIFYLSIEDRGLVIGPPGTGKTAFLFNQVLRATKSGLNMVIVDLKPELHKVLAKTMEASGYRVLRINPAKVDPTADHWNPLADICDEVDIAEMCAALLPIRDAKEAPFIEAQRDWLKAAVFHVSSMPGGSIPAAFNLLSSNADPLKLLDVIGRSTSPTAARLARCIAAGLSGGKPDPLILQGLTGALRGLDYLGLSGVQDALGYSDFSVRDLGKGGRPTALFLQFEEAKINALGPLLAFMATGVITALIDTAGQRAPVALFLDELGNMPPIPNLPEKLNTIRSRHIPTWMYFQTVEQMNSRYGRGAENIFFAASDFQMVFRLNDASTRELISKLIGTTKKEKLSQSKNGDKGSTTRSSEIISVIEPYELGQLAKGEVVVLYQGAAARGRATPHFVDFPSFKRKEK